MLFFSVIISKNWEGGGAAERNLTVQEKLKRFEHLGAFERDWLLFSDSFLLACTGDIGFCYLSYLNVQVAMDNADLSERNRNMKTVPLCQQLSVCHQSVAGNLFGY